MECPTHATLTSRDVGIHPQTNVRSPTVYHHTRSQTKAEDRVPPGSGEARNVSRSPTNSTIRFCLEPTTFGREFPSDTWVTDPSSSSISYVPKYAT